MPFAIPGWIADSKTSLLSFLDSESQPKAPRERHVVYWDVGFYSHKHFTHLSMNPEACTHSASRSHLLSLIRSLVRKRTWKSRGVFFSRKKRMGSRCWPIDETRSEIVGSSENRWRRRVSSWTLTICSVKCFTRYRLELTLYKLVLWSREITASRVCEKLGPDLAK